jgi:hypothetical protein
MNKTILLADGCQAGKVLQRQFAWTIANYIA